MVSIEFGSRQAANDVRDRVSQYLSRTDDRRESTVRLKRSTPDNILERVKEKSFESREGRAKGFGKANLSEGEKSSLKKTTGFNWQQHGFEAMSAKAAAKAQGVTEWIDYYEPGEGVGSTLSKIRDAKGRATQNRASIGIESMRTDQEEQGNVGRQSRQAEKASAKRVESAKRPAIVESDPEATAFLREEMDFGNSPFDVQGGSGRDVELVEERHESRSAAAQRKDETMAAPKTNNPLVWASDPAHYDFPGVDTIDPEVVQETRSKRARSMDANKSAPIAESKEQWAAAPDQYDLPGVDTPSSTATEANPGVGDSGMMGSRPAASRLSQDAFEGLAADEQAEKALAEAESARSAGEDLKDTRAQQDTLGFAADPTEARESRVAAEKSDGGILEDTRESVGRGADTDSPDVGEQAGLSDMDAARDAMDAMDTVDKDMKDLDRF